MNPLFLGNAPNISDIEVLDSFLDQLASLALKHKKHPTINELLRDFMRKVLFGDSVMVIGVRKQMVDVVWKICISQNEPTTVHKTPGSHRFIRGF